MPALGSLVSSVPSGFLADRLGRKPVLIGTAILTPLCLAGVGLITSAPLLLVFSLLQGIVSSAYWVTNLPLLVEKHDGAAACWRPGPEQFSLARHWLLWQFTGWGHSRICGGPAPCFRRQHRSLALGCAQCGPGHAHLRHTALVFTRTQTRNAVSTSSADLSRGVSHYSRRNRTSRSGGGRRESQRQHARSQRETARPFIRQAIASRPVIHHG